MKQLLKSDYMGEIRAFLAIDLKPQLKDIISYVEYEFKEIDADVKYVNPKNLHLTLKFFGNITTEGIDLISNKVEKVIKDFKPFEIVVQGCGAFPNTNKIRVIWIGTDNTTELKQLHDALDNEFQKIGFDAYKKFSSHLTIGRMKSPKNKDLIKAKIEEMNEFSFDTIYVDQIKLKKSTLTPRGPIYEDLKAFKM